MKKVLKILGGLIGLVISLLIVGAVAIHLRGIPTYDVPEIDHQVEITPEKVARGQKLASMLCVACHLNQNSKRLSGTQMLDAPPEFGKIYSKNITQDKEYGIGNWTDGDLLYLLRTGVTKHGEYTPPYMPKFPHMADDDIDAIIAFLRSNDPLVAADATPDKPSEVSFLTKFLATIAFKPLPMPEQSISLPDTSNQIEIGKYLSFALDCYSCHAPDFKVVNIMEPEKTPGYMGGGNKPLDMNGNVILSSNITPDPETGIGNWSEERFVKAVKFGMMEGEPALRYPMAPYAQLSDAEAKAIYAYLMSIPPISNEISRPSD